MSVVRLPSLSSPQPFAESQSRPAGASRVCCRRGSKWASTLFDPRKTGSAAQMLIAVAIGTIVGITVRAQVGSSPEKLSYYVDWVSLPGKAFVKLMKCFDIPLIALNICVGVQGILKLENAGVVGSRTMMLYMFTAACAAAQGIGVFYAFYPWMHQLKRDQTAQSPSYIALQCPNGNFFQQSGSGNSSALSCTGPPNNPELFQATIFHDLLTAPGIPHSTSDIFKTLIETFATDNFVASFSAPNVLAVMFLAAVFGLAIARVPPASPGGNSRVLVDIMVQLRETFIIIMEHLIGAAQVGLASLMAGAVASANRPALVPIDIFLLVSASFVAYLFHSLLFMPAVLACLIRRNPWTFLWTFRSAIRKTLRTGSADEALDKTVECAVESGEISPDIAGFVLPLGVDLNLNGAGIYYPLSVLYLTAVSGYTLDVTWGTVVIIMFVSTMSSIGSHVMPNGGIIMILAIWQASFMGVYDAPLELAFPLAIAWVLDRAVATCNVVSDVMIAKIVDVTTPGRHEEAKKLAAAQAAQAELNADAAGTFDGHPVKPASPDAGGEGGGRSTSPAPHGHGKGHGGSSRRSLWDATGAQNPLGLVDVNEVLKSRRALAAAGLTSSSMRGGSPSASKRGTNSSNAVAWGDHGSSAAGTLPAGDSPVVNNKADKGGAAGSVSSSAAAAAVKPQSSPPPVIRVTSDSPLSIDMQGDPESDLEVGGSGGVVGRSMPRGATMATMNMHGRPPPGMMMMDGALSAAAAVQVPYLLDERFMRAARASRQAVVSVEQSRQQRVARAAHMMMAARGAPSPASQPQAALLPLPASFPVTPDASAGGALGEERV